MFQIGNSLVSEEIITNDFVCNLNACKGACCVDGEAGAPLDKEETKLLEKNYDLIAPFLNEKGKAAIEYIFFNYFHAIVHLYRHQVLAITECIPSNNFD